MSEPLLSVEGLRVAFETDHGVVHAVDGISYAVAPGRTLGIVGESGAGKTVSARTLLGLTRGPRTQIGGRIMFGGGDLASLGEEGLRHLAGDVVALTTHDPLSALHPLYPVGAQVIEAIRAHRAVSKAAARDRAIGLLELVGIPDPHRRVDAYPHELPPGLRQRAMIAVALANGPKLLIADDPTRGLDVTVQAQILALLADLGERLGMAIVYLTRDLGTVAEIADEVAVMYAGRIVELAPAGQLFLAPQHPYTWGLLRSLPRLPEFGVEQPVPISGPPPSLIQRPQGCHFHPRCPYAQDSHRRIDPQLRPAEGEEGHSVACLLPASVRRQIWQGLEAGHDLPSLQQLAGVLVREGRS
ncbi:MAG TPA: ABC transporter ATP-binding protein [Solirubrobacteraceae bacterium]|nr:ABC transporter ATP-binding protein [Solirubrobacteraceae bacterium]